MHIVVSCLCGKGFLGPVQIFLVFVVVFFGISIKKRTRKI